jgi:hypothetical protein
MDRLDVDHYDSHSNASHRDYKSIPLSCWVNILEIVEATGFITPYLLHPVRGLNTYLPTMGATPFDPESSIGDLCGKVILVTGGWSLLLGS